MREQAAKGAVWTLVNKAGGQSLNFLSFLILARLLVPENYGVVTLAGIFISIPAVLLTEGFSTAIVQKPTLDEPFISTVFWANVGLSLVLLTILLLAAKWIAELAQMPEIETVLQVLALNFIGSGISSVPYGLLQREFRYSAFVVRTMLSTIAGAIVSIPMALHGYGV